MGLVPTSFHNLSHHVIATHHNSDFYLLSSYFVASPMLGPWYRIIQIKLLNSFCRRGNWGTERVNKLPKITQLVSKYLAWDLNSYFSNAKTIVFWVLTAASQLYCPVTGFTDVATISKIF